MRNLSEKFKDGISSLKDKFDPENMSKVFQGGDFGASVFGRILGKNKDNMKSLGKKKPKTEDVKSSPSSGRKVGNIDTAFYTTVAEGQRGKLRKKDGVADVAGKLTNFLIKSQEDKKLQFQLERNFALEQHDEDKRRHQEFLKALQPKKQVDKLKKSKKKIEKEGEKATKETKKVAKPTTTTKTKAPSTPSPKSSTTPSAPATNVPSAPSVASTATKVPTPSGGLKYGYLTAAGLAAVTSAHEGNAESVYGDYKDKKTGQIVNKYSDRPEDWSEKNLGKRKKLTDFTFAELLQYQKYRNSIKESSGAVGIAGFMPSTIFGKNLDGKNGLFQQSGLSWNDRFTEDNQMLLKNIMDAADDKILESGLKRLGITTGITPGMKLAANYVGAAGLLAVIEEGQLNPNITVKDALIKRFPKNGDPTRGNTINTDLGTTLAKDFIANKEQFAIKKATQMGLVNDSGNKIDNSSKENKDLKEKPSGNTVGVNNSKTVINTSSNQKPQVISQTPSLDYPTFMSIT